MGGRRRLRRGLPRLLSNHSSVLGKALRREYDGLCRALGLHDGDALLCGEAAAAAMTRLRAAQSAATWAELVERQRRGRGRRPSAQQLERARRAAALDAQDSRAATDRLRELVAERPRTPADLLARAQAAMRADAVAHEVSDGE